MKKTLTIICLLSIFSALKSQDALYTINNWDATGITQYSSVNPSTGTFSGTTTTYGTTDASAAMALNTGNYIYYIPYSSNTGIPSIYSIPAYPTPSTTTAPTTPTLALTGPDINGTSDNDIYFRRLGVRKDNWAYMISTEVNTGTIYLSRFLTHTDGTADNFQNLGTISLSDQSTSAGFNNGDLAFDGNGNMYVLVNQDVTGGNTKIYFLSAAGVNAAGTSSQVTQLEYKWHVLGTDGNNFSSAVTGLAFSSTGSLYITAQGDDGGLLFLDQSTADPVTGTVMITKTIAPGRSMGDVATNYFPLETTLPVHYGKMDARIINNELQVNWTTLSEEDNAHFDIEVSNDGVHFNKAGTINSKATSGNSSKAIDYTFKVNLDNNLSLLGISIFSLSMLLLFFNRKNKLLFMLTAFLSLGIISCSKNSSEQIDENNENKVFVRIVQVDKDGTQKVSKILTAYKAD